MKIATQLMLTTLAALLFVASPTLAQDEKGHEGHNHAGHDHGDHAVKAKPASEASTDDFGTTLQKLSYVIGTQIGGSFKQQDMDIDLTYLLNGIKDVLAGKEPAISQAEQQKVMEDFRKEAQAKQIKAAAENAAKSKEFLTANKAKEGVVELPSGLQYKIITKGTGATPTTADTVKTHYRGTLVNGEEFDSSYKRGTPAEFPVTGVIKGWTEALQLMKEGDKWELYIPSDLAYGPQGRPGIPPSSTLIFELELLEVVKTAAKPVAPTVITAPK